jgi:hypothetical protein
LASSRAEIKGLVATPGKRMSNQEKEQTMGWGKGSVFELAMRILEDHMSKEAEKRLHFGLPRKGHQRRNTREVTRHQTGTRRC